MENNFESMDNTLFTCKKCNKQEIGNREVFKQDKHCSCSMPEWDREMLRTGAQYIEQSAIVSDDENTAEVLNGTIREVQPPVNVGEAEAEDE